MVAPAVSVVIPTYNHARFLKAAILSVLDQSSSDWEALVVNNYSEDDTTDVVAGFGDPRIRLVNFRNHGIIAASRNHGIGLAQGEFVAFLDSDDVWYSDKLKYCMEGFRKGAEVVCHGETWVTDGSRRRNVFYGPQRRTSYSSLLYDGNCLSTSAIVVRKSALDRVGGFSEDPQMVTAEDYELWLRLAKSGCRFVFIDRVLGEFRIHGGNASMAVMRNCQAELAVAQKHLAEVPDNGFFSRLRKRRRIALAYYHAGRGMQKEGAQGSGLRLLYRSWLEFPFIWKQYAAAGLGLLKWLLANR